MKTTQVAKEGEFTRDWYLIDVENKVLGRVATEIASILRGKKKPIYTPSVDTGDFVIVVNAEKIALTGNKLADKTYYSHSGFPGGLKVGYRRQTPREKTGRAPQDCCQGDASQKQACTPYAQQAEDLLWYCTSAQGADAKGI